MTEPLPHPVPFGWFLVSYSDELAPGDVRPVRYFGRELVLFRTADGVPCLLDAYCPHLGAHLGHGGQVDGDALRCPFHAWAWAPDGRCVDVPYAKRMPAKVERAGAVQSYPVVERNQVIWAWYHPAGEKPFFEVVEHPEIGDSEWEPLVRYEWRFRGSVQEIAENGVDPAHFRYVHGMEAVPEGNTTYDGHMRRSAVEGPRTWENPDGTVETGTSRLLTVQNGAGQKWTRFWGRTETLLMTIVTPVDDQEVELRFAFTRRREPPGSPEEEIGRQSIESIAGGVEDDIRIWSHKVHQLRPLLCDGDGPIPEFRRYFSQFYVDSHVEPAAGGNA